VALPKGYVSSVEAFAEFLAVHLSDKRSAVVEFGYPVRGFCRLALISEVWSYQAVERYFLTVDLSELILTIFFGK
jgi:hypothetical protein